MSAKPAPYVFAARGGLLSIVAVIASLYPAATVLLARFILHERFAPVQLAGFGFAAGAVALIAAAPLYGAVPLEAPDFIFGAYVADKRTSGAPRQACCSRG